MRDRQSIIRREWSRNASGEAKRLPPFSFRLPQFALVAAFDPLQTLAALLASSDAANIPVRFVSRNVSATGL